MAFKLRAVADTHAIGDEVVKRRYVYIDKSTGKTMTLLAPLDADPRMAGHHRLDAVRGHLLERAGEAASAIAAYQRAAGKTSSMPERDYLLMKAARLRERQDVFSRSSGPADTVD
jgi:predicted RNA polymerase sigma factor